MLFAVERYDESGAGLDPHALFPTLPAALHLAVALYLPADEVVLALIEGPDANSVDAAVTAAGWRVDRISPASWVAPFAELAADPAARTGGSPLSLLSVSGNFDEPSPTSGDPSQDSGPSGREGSDGPVAAGR